MRVTGGIYGGRIIKSVPGNDTRPTPDKVRQAIFNMLMHDIEDTRVLDLFAGSGALGIEALSRGAREAVFVENGRSQVKIIRDNLAGLGLSATVIERDYKKACKALSEAGEKFDIVFADPPYDLLTPLELADRVAEYNLLEPNGFLIIEHRAGREFENDKWHPTRHKKYGQTEVTVYVR